MQPTTMLVVHVDVLHHREDFQKESVEMDTSLMGDSYKSPILQPQLLPCDDDNLSVSRLSNIIMKPTSQSNCNQQVDVQLENENTASDQSESDDDFQISYFPKQWNELPDELQCVLPKEYSYLIEEYNKLPHSTCHSPRFKAQFRINLQDEEGVSQWLNDFQSHSMCTYRITRTYKLQFKKVKYKVDMHCQHFRKKLTSKQLAQSSCSRKKSVSLVSDTRNKKTQCASKLFITVQIPSKSLVAKRPQASNLQEYHTLVKLNFDHNHATVSAEALGFRPVLDETKQKYIDLFKMGHSVSSAHFYYETLLLTNQSGDIQKSIADRALNPTKQDVYRLFNAWRQSELGDDNGESLFKQLEHEIEVYNEKWKDQGGCAKLQPFKSSCVVDPVSGDDTDKENDNDSDVSTPKPKRQKRESSQPFVLALCTPLMARAHACLPQAAEIVYCDATSSLDRFNTALFIISTSHAAGGIPLAVLMTSDEKLSTIYSGLCMLKDILPSNAFYGNGVGIGPKVIMTDDSATEKGALRKMWPKSTQLLCVFHFLQRQWTWLWEGKNKIQHSDRTILIEVVKKIVYASTEEQFRQSCKDLKTNETALKYPHFLKHMESLYSDCKEWALSFREDLLIRGNHTNNYSEASIGILKELIFKRVKAYNLIQMFEFVTEAFEFYHQRRLLSVAHNRLDCFISVKYRGLNASKIPKGHISQISEDNFIVKSSRNPDDTYHVDMAFGICSCKHGKDGSPCSHQAAVVLHYHHKSLNFIPTMHAPSRKQLAYIALGDQAEKKLEFYADIFHEPDGKEMIEKTKSETCWAIIEEGSKDEEIVECQNGLDDNPEFKKNESIEAALNEVFVDISEKLKQKDPQFISGIQKFIDRYNGIKSDAVLASSFHKFGKFDTGKSTCLRAESVRHGIRIPIQASAAGRRKYGTRGKGPSSKGRPSKYQRRLIPRKPCSRYTMTIRKEPKGKRHHNLSKAIRVGQQNAGKW